MGFAKSQNATLSYQKIQPRIIRKMTRYKKEIDRLKAKKASLNTKTLTGIAWLQFIILCKQNDYQQNKNDLKIQKG